MKIVDSAIVMNSQHLLVKSYSSQQTLRIWKRSAPEGSQGAEEERQSPEDWMRDQLEISKQALDAFREEQAKAIRARTGNNLSEIPDEVKTKIQLLEQLLKSLTGKTIKLQLPERLAPSQNSPAVNVALQPVQLVRSEPIRGFEVTLSQSYHESEQLSFTAGGVIRTADGQEIAFDVQLNLSRSFVQESSQIFRYTSQTIDPLVINFDGTAAQLTDTKFSFDLDSDGDPDQISFLKPGSGFLALDQNSDGLINNGTELFGPASGDGFADLSGYDSDGNGWIDENDPIFDRLRIWTKDENGNDQLFALGVKGVGAIYLGNIGADFTMTNPDNEALGQNRSAGIFVKESGQVGTMQQIDLVV